MIIPRTVNARLIERLIFNFRVEPDALARHLPAPYLEPLIVNGWSVVSFCILRLDQLILWPLPGFLGYQTISCAYRCGVIDTSDGKREPSVYVTDRITDLPVISRLGPWIFADTFPTVRPAITRNGDTTTISVRYLDEQRVFEATANPAKSPGVLGSEVFSSMSEFSNFIQLGVSSYTPSIYGDALVRMDLRKKEPTYEALDASIDFSSLDGVWPDTGMAYDSAVRATGGTYTWIYRGLALIDPTMRTLRPQRPMAMVFRGLRRAQPLPSQMRPSS